MKSHSNRKQISSLEKGDTKKLRRKISRLVFYRRLYSMGRNEEIHAYNNCLARIFFFPTKAMESGSSKTLLHISSGQVDFFVNDICVEEESFSQIFPSTSL